MDMDFKADQYDPNEILRFVRQCAGKTQAEFGKDIDKSREWVQANELGRTNYLFKDFLKLCKKNDIEIIIKSKEPPKN